MLTVLVLSNSANQIEVNLATNELKYRGNPLRELNTFTKKVEAKVRVGRSLWLAEGRRWRCVKWVGRDHRLYITDGRTSVTSTTVVKLRFKLSHYY